MKIKKAMRGFGKFFIALRQEDEKIINQSILLVDNGYGWTGHLEAAINKLGNSFPKAEISVFTLPKRMPVLQEEFPSLKFILPRRWLWPKRYQIALEILLTRRKKHDFVVLFSLDITPLIASLLFLRPRKIVLYNQWGQWWPLRLRKVNEAFKVTYVKKKSPFSLKSIIKRAGLFLVLLERQDEKALSHSILIIDNGRSLFGQVAYPIQQMKDYLPLASVSLLAPEQRIELKDVFPGVSLIKPGKSLIKKYAIARHMLRLRKKGYDYVILLSLDITPIIVSILFINTRVILCNQWHQWWSLKLRPVRGYLIAIPQFLLNILILIYLAISVAWVFLKRSLNVFRFNLFRRQER